MKQILVPFDPDIIWLTDRFAFSGHWCTWLSIHRSSIISYIPKIQISFLSPYRSYRERTWKVKKHLEIYQALRNLVVVEYELQYFFVFALVQFYAFDKPAWQPKMINFNFFQVQKVWIPEISFADFKFYYIYIIDYRL